MAFPTFEKQADIPKGFEGEYEEQGGKWVPKVPDVATLEGTLAKVRTEKKAEEAARKQAEAERAALERRLAAATTQDDKGEVAKALAKFDADLAAAKATMQTEIANRDAVIERMQIDDRFVSLFGGKEIGGRPEKAKAALKQVRDRLALGEAGRMVIKDEKGNVTSQTIEDFLSKTFRAEMPEFYKGSMGVGGGAQGGAGTFAGGDLSQERAGELLRKNPLALLEQANAAMAGAK